MTCRLPQTPRTPTAAAAHYFDDIWAPTGKPKKPHHLRRSSTSRSIGFRSDYAASAEEEEDEPSQLNRSNSIGYLDSEELKRKAEIDDKVAHYVSDQLERVKSGESGELDHDEFETSLDGAFDKPKSKNGRRNGDGDYFSQ
jgi:hypothetical protein